MELTDAMRRAVLTDLCARDGHNFTTITALTNGEPQPGGATSVLILNTRNHNTPHLKCERCAHVWLLVELDAHDYDTAEQELIDRLRDDDSLAAKLRERRELRTTPAIDDAPDEPQEQHTHG